MSATLCRDCCELVDATPPACELCGSARLIAHEEIASLSIAHVDCDAFYASVEKRDRPELAEVPLIVGHAGGRGVVTTACYIARRFGIRSAMPMFKAMELCPAATVISPDMAKYKAVSERIRVILLAATPLIEPVSLDEAYLDMSEEVRHEGPTAAAALASVALRVEREVGITVSIGLSANKFLAKLASDMRKPRGFSVIGRAEAVSVLAPLSVRKIHGVGPATAHRIEQIGLRTIADLQALSEAELIAHFGVFGRRLAHYAHGKDDREVTSARQTKSVSAETTFRADTRSAADLRAAAENLCARVAAALARKSLAGRTLVLKLKTSEFRLLTRHRQLAHPTQQAAVLSRAAARLIEKEADGRSFRLIGIGVTDLSTAAHADPPDLFGGC